MEAQEMTSVERPRKGIWYVVGSVPLLTEMLMLVLDRLHRLTLGAILFLDVVVVLAAFICAALLVPREDAMVIGPRYCIEHNIMSLDLPPPPEGGWFQSWRVDDNDTACSHVLQQNRAFKGFFIGGRVNTSFQMPLRKNRVLNPFKSVHRYMKGYIIMELDLSDSSTLPTSDATVRLRLGGRDGGGRQLDWEQLGRAEVPLSLDTCQPRYAQENASEPDHCVVSQRLFEVASLDREFYLLNAGVLNMTHLPLEMNLLVVYQRRPYTLTCLHTQAVFAGLLLLLLALFLIRVKRVYRTVPSGHVLLAVLAVALIVWDIPIGYIALDYDVPWLGILDAVRLDLFYLAFLAFCLIFVWEQAFIKGVKRSAGRLLPPLVPLLFGCLLLLALDVTQQAQQLSDVFSSRPDWLRFSLAALLLLNVLYVVVLCAAAAAGWRRGWRRSALPGRYRALMVVTCLTAAAACMEHAERRESDNSWFWSWTDQRPTGGHVFYIGMLVWYNVFVVTLLVLFLPTRPLVELAEPIYQDEQKVPLYGGDAPEPIKREAQPDEK